MPAAAVIPAPIAYIKVVAVKKLVVGFQPRTTGPSFTERHLVWPRHLLVYVLALDCAARTPGHLL